MHGKITDLASKLAEADAELRELRIRRCFACLSSRRPEKRGCPIARLAADGFEHELFIQINPSLKTEH